MKSITRFITLIAIVFAAVSISTTAIGQSKPSIADLKKKLISSPWKVETIWNATAMTETGDSVTRWEETAIDSSYHYGDHFGVTSIQFFKNGAFKGIHFKGKSVKGEWSLKSDNKTGGIVFSLRFEADLDEDHSHGYPYRIKFDYLSFSDDGFIAGGDICYDGCHQKVKFVKTKEF